MSRQPRFAGQGRRWFSVLDHSLFCDEMVQKMDQRGLVDLPGIGTYITPKLRLAVLLHDAHESMTGDIPTDWKGDGMKLKQIVLDRLIMDAFFSGGIATYTNHHAGVKAFDRRALVVEAQVIGPPATLERTVEIFGITDYTPEDKTLLGRMLYGFQDWFGVSPWTYNQTNHPGVKEYTRRVLELM
jgi:hypothetical protein